MLVTRESRFLFSFGVGLSENWDNSKCESLVSQGLAMI